MADEQLTDEQKKSKYLEWLKSRWRPFIAWQYLIVCVFDFIIAPIMTIVLSSMYDIPYVQWTPMTTEEGGLYHMSMMAILGVYAWSRGQEKMTFMNKFRRPNYYNNSYNQQEGMDGPIIGRQE